MIFRAPSVLIILALGYSCFGRISASTGSTRGETTIMKTLGKLYFSEGEICPKRLTKLCKREPNFTEVLQEAVKLASEHCHEQFRYTRWNCTLNEELFHEVSRETSVVTAIFAASLSHTFARSCVGTKFSKCNQTTEPKFIWTKRVSQLKGPSDDIKFGRRMARKILLGTGKKRLEKRRKNFIDAISLHNVEVGLRQAAAKMEETCKCNAYSSFCALQICRKSLTHLNEVAKVLRSRYTEAKMIHEAETGKTVSGNYRFPKKEKNRFYYTTPSPNFCKDTHGRECKDEMNCSILCCARGFKTWEIKKSRKCRCVMSGKCCDIKCQTCLGLERKYICK